MWNLKKMGIGGAAVAAAASVAALSGTPSAWAAPRKKVALVDRVETPAGLQGTQGTGADIGVIFVLIDESRRRTDVEVQYGIDLNGDGFVTEDEFRPATENRAHLENTRKNKKPQLFTTSGDIGAVQNYVWRSTADIESGRFTELEYKFTANGRPIPDPNTDDGFLFADTRSGVVVRVRAVRPSRNRKGSRTQVGDWAYSEAFSINNNNPPSMRIDAVLPNSVSVPTASDENVLIEWTAFDPDSEDKNGNGVLDVDQGEDRNNNLVLDDERVAVAFDYHRVEAGEDPAAMSPAQLEALSWLPATRAAGVGDGDSFAGNGTLADGTPIVNGPLGTSAGGVGSAIPGVGRPYTFAWDSVTDVGTVYAQFIVRARPFDAKREHGDFVYYNTPFTLDNWRIFSPGGVRSSLSTPRVGHTVTHLPVGLERSDPLKPEPFQSFLVAGGANVVGGGGVASLDLMQVNTRQAETSAADRVPLQLATARAWHSATLLDDGRVLLAGGFDASGTVPLTSTEIFDPRTRTVEPGPALLTARAKHAAVRLASGDVAVLGGVGSGG